MGVLHFLDIPASHWRASKPFIGATKYVLATAAEKTDSSMLLAVCDSRSIVGSSLVPMEAGNVNRWASETGEKTMVARLQNLFLVLALRQRCVSVKLFEAVVKFIVLLRPMRTGQNRPYEGCRAASFCTNLFGCFCLRLGVFRQHANIRLRHWRDSGN